MGLYKLFLLLGLPGAFGLAIITLTVVVRLLFHPFFKQQIESQKQLAALKPKIAELEKKYKDDKTRLQQAQMDLYKEHGINPASGCLFAVIQIPIFIGVYQTLQHFVNAASSEVAAQTINKLLYSPALALSKIDPTFFIYNLAIAPEKHKLFAFSFTKGFAFFPENMGYAHYLLVPVITGLLQYIQAQKTLAAAPPPQAEKKEDAKETKKEESFSGDFQSAMNTQMKYFFPLMIVFFSYQLPVGLSLYWNIFSLFGIMQSIGKTKTLNTKS